MKTWLCTNNSTEANRFDNRDSCDEAFGSFHRSFIVTLGCAPHGLLIQQIKPNFPNESKCEDRSIASPINACIIVYIRPGAGCTRAIELRKYIGELEMCGRLRENWSYCIKVLKWSSDQVIIQVPKITRPQGAWPWVQMRTPRQPCVNIHE